MSTNLELQQFSVSKTTKYAVAEAQRIICRAQAELTVPNDSQGLVSWTYVT